MGLSNTTIGSTKAHAHSNAAGDGGALSNATLLNTPTLINKITQKVIIGV